MHIRGHAAYEFDDAMIDERCPGLEACLLACAFDFGDPVIGKVIKGIGQHHGADKALAIGCVFPIT